MRDSPTLPRTIGAVRELLSDRRVVVGMAAVLLVAAGGLWGLFLHHPGPATASPPPFAVHDPPAPVDGSYRVVGQLHTTGVGETFYVARSRTYAPGDPAVAVGHWTFGGADDRTTVVVYERATTSYVRQTWINASEYRELLAARMDDEGVVRVDNATQSIYTIERDEEGVEAAPIGGIPLSALGQLRYERRGTTTYRGREVVRYVPTAGWLTRDFGPRDAPRTVRIRAAGGEVLVDPETGAVLYAEVEATIIDAETWAGVLAGPAIEIAVRYRVEPDVERPTPPPWVDALRERANATGRR